MKAPLSPEQWGAMRALVEGNPPTHARVAAGGGVSATTLSHRAAQEGWLSLDFRSLDVRKAHADFVERAARHRRGEPLDDPAGGDGWAEAPATRWDEAAVLLPPLPVLPTLPAAERVARLKAMLIARVEAFLQQAEAGRPIEARQVAALSKMLELAERIEPARPTFTVESAAPKLDDEQLAANLQRIDDRIVYLAGEHAVRLLMTAGLSEEAARQAVHEGAVRDRTL